MKNDFDDFYVLFLAILYRIYKLNPCFDSLSLLRCSICNEYLRNHPNRSVEEVLKLYYQSLKQAILENKIICQEGKYVLITANFLDNDMNRKRTLALQYARIVTKMEEE